MTQLETLIAAEAAAMLAEPGTIAAVLEKAGLPPRRVPAALALAVRRIFLRYRELGSVRRLKQALDKEGIRSKPRLRRNGSDAGGAPFSRGALYALLANPIYIGEIAHKGARYPSISRMLRKLVLSGDVLERADTDDSRMKKLFLSEAGRERAAAIHSFANSQVANALERLAPREDRTVVEGLRLYAEALASNANRTAFPQIGIVRGYRQGIIARMTQMHALYYARTSGFGQKERERLHREREKVSNQQQELEDKLAQIDRELEAIDAYEAAKSGKAITSKRSAPARRQARGRRTRSQVPRGSRRGALLQVIRENPDGLRRGEILERMGLKGDKSGEMSVSNALTALTKGSQVSRHEGKYFAQGG